MGGFTVNGCGTGDRFYPKLGLGQHYCQSCRSIQPYALMEVKRKIEVFFIPTVSISTKYAVACKKCKTGYYIEDNIRNELLYGRMGIEVQPDKILFKRLDGQKVPSLQKENSAAERPDTGANAPLFCKCCGAQLQPGQAFCTSCGVRIG